MSCFVYKYKLIFTEKNAIKYSVKTFNLIESFIWQNKVHCIFLYKLVVFFNCIIELFTYIPIVYKFYVLIILCKA